MYRILFVCTGNICRSPTAEGVLRHRLELAGLHEHVAVDSAGTHGYHIGETPDGRSIKAAQQRGIDLTNQRARQVQPKDFSTFDLILALDAGHLRQLQHVAPHDSTAQLSLFLDYAQCTPEREVPDPYYGGAEGFEYVLDLVEKGSEGVIARLRQLLKVDHASFAAQGN